jgi:hypothetical protein
VNFSSEAVYGATAGPLTEEVPVKPSTPYAVTKVTAEWLGKVYSNRYALDVVSLRIGQVYGPGNRMPEVLGDMLKALTRTGVFTLAQEAITASTSSTSETLRSPLNGRSSRRDHSRLSPTTILALHLRLDGAPPGDHRSLAVNAHLHLTGYLREGDDTRFDRLDLALLVEDRPIGGRC